MKEKRLRLTSLNPTINANTNPLKTYLKQPMMNSTLEEKMVARLSLLSER